MRSAILPVLTLAASPALAADWDYGERNAPGLEPAFADQTRAPQLEDGPALSVEVLAEGLEHPWGIAVLPEGGYLVTERPGRLRHVGAKGGISAPLTGVPEVLADGQGGLLDVSLAEDFAETGQIWLTYAKPVEGGLSATAAAVARFDAEAGALKDLSEVFVQEPASPSPMHFGSRVVPAGDHVYVTTGEHFTEEERQFAQDPAKTYGKVVRLMADGSVPADNPFAGQGGAAGQVWSLGHRNVQGAALAPDGGLWTLEHGPQGGDELNRIEKGANHGWPVVSYGENYNGSAVGTGIAHRDGMAEPVYFWDPVIAPGGFVFYDGAMFPDWQGNVIAASLNPGGLVRLTLDDGRVTGEARYLVGSARFRDVAVDRDGAILAVTDAEDGQLLRITPE
ncbi:MAG: PQQ-dependent sugar dehydrogenase [Albidovulum sp.]